MNYYLEKIFICIETDKCLAMKDRWQPISASIYITVCDERKDPNEFHIYAITSISFLSGKKNMLLNIP
jgi:hypothetical protein